MPGTRVEHVYRVGHMLGKGNFSTVMLGEHFVTGERVALKIIPSEKYRKNERAKWLLKTEVAVMNHIRHLNHPHIMEFLRLFEDSEKVVMVLELLSGGQLLERIVSKGHYSERDASQLTKVIVSALVALHDIGVLHRDLKPENCVYLTPAEDSILKITDFGLAIFTKAEDKTANDQHLVGTPGYLAPEVLESRTYSPASDVWAAGVMLFILLSGTPPFWGRTHREIFDKIRYARWSLDGSTWEFVSPLAKDLVVKMLAQDPRDRITAEGILQHPWILGFDAVSSAPLIQSYHELKRLNARQKFRAAVLACIAGNRLQRYICDHADVCDEIPDSILGSSVFTTTELDMLKTEFLRASQGRAVLSFSAFKDIMVKLKMDHIPLDRIFSVFDTNGNGDVDYREFLIGVSKFKLQGETAIRFCFDVFDEDASGTISRDELTKVLLHMVRHQNKCEAILTGNPMEEPREADGVSRPMSWLAASGTDDVMDVVEMQQPNEMDPEVYELVEGITELFDNLDADGDGQITFDEFFDGTKRFPQLLDLFFNNEPAGDHVNDHTGPGGAGAFPQASFHMADVEV